MAKVGRPKGNNNKVYSYTIRMDKYVKRRLDAYCERMHVGKAEAIRNGILAITDEFAFDENFVRDLEGRLHGTINGA